MGYVKDQAGVTALETDPLYSASAASTITNAGSNEVITAAERAALGTAVQAELDPVFISSAASTITDAGSNEVITAAERATLGSALQAELDPEVGANTTGYLSRWDGSALVSSLIFDNGNVGIGTTNPAYKLDVVGDIQVSESLKMDTSTDKEIRFVNGRIIDQSVPNRLTVEAFAAGKPLFLRGPGGIEFYSGSERMRITSTGDIGIGTTSPSNKLTVAGTIESTSGGLKFPDGTTQTTAATSDNNPTSFFEVFLSANQSIGYYSAKVNWAQEDSDTNNEFDLNTDRFTVKVAGMYMLQAVGTITSSQTRDSTVQLRKNNVVIAEATSTPGWNNRHSTNSISIMVNANVGDYFEVWASQVSGDNNRYALGGKQYTYFKGYRLK